MSDEISAAPAPWKVADQYVMRDARDIRDANGALVAVGVSSADARIIVDAVNFYDATVDTQLTALLAERDRLRDELTRKAKNYEDVIAYHQRTEDRLRDIVRRTVETLEQVYKHADMTDYLRADVVEMQREARAAIGEGQP